MSADSRNHPDSCLASPTAALRLGAIALLLLVGSVPVAIMTHAFTLSSFMPEAVAEASFAGVGVVVAYNRPQNRMGWILLGAAGFLLLNNLAS